MTTILEGSHDPRVSFSVKSMKVAQLAGYCAEQSNYHHGEQCLYETIIKMSHYFPGSNNLNLSTIPGSELSNPDFSKPFKNSP